MRRSYPHWVSGSGTENPVNKPLIGVTPSFKNGVYSLSSNYCESVEHAGGIPVILPYAFDSNHIINGLLLTGGGDLSPEISGCEISASIAGVSPERDAFESRIFKEAMASDIPILGICRGHQLINCLLGGTLIRDISEAGYTERHNRTTDPNDRHPLRTVPGTLLHKLIDNYKEVCSTHHQAVKTLGKGLIASAYSPNGIIEGIEHASGRIIGLQTHPERMNMSEPFEWLVEMAYKNRS